MNFHARNTQPGNQRTACAIVGVFENKRQTDAAKAIDKATNGAVTFVFEHHEERLEHLSNDVAS